MRDRLKLALQFDAGAMRADLLGLEQSAWIDHYVKQNYDGVWTVLPLRATAGAQHPIATIYSDPSVEAFEDTALLARCPYFHRVLASFACPLHAVRLMKLAPGSAIKPHRDHDLASELGRARLHVPVITNPAVEFLLNGSPVVMREGECWYLNLSDTHSVVNRGDADRIHLVIDALVNPWLEEQLVHAERVTQSSDRARFVPASHVAQAQDPAQRDLTGWVPFKVRAGDGEAMVDWCSLGEERFTAPFFGDTIARCLRGPGKTLVEATSMETLLQRYATHPGLQPTAFIFHGSRCGSTLLAQMAAALADTIVISEAAPIDQILGANVDKEDRRIEWLRALMSALGQPRAEERHLIVKFDAWHTSQIGLVQRAFPGVPCVFVYRDPAEVVASQMRMPGLHTVPGTIDPSAIGLNRSSATQVDREEYVSRVFGAIYSAAAAEAAAGRVTLINYSELPERGFSQVLAWCSPQSMEHARERLRHVAQFDSKTPSLPFDPESSPRSLLTPRAADTIARFVQPYYVQLEEIRLAQNREA